MDYKEIEKKIEDINMQIQDLAEEKIRLENKLMGKCSCGNDFKTEEEEEIGFCSECR